MAGHPAASVVAMADPVISLELQRIFSTDIFRVYTNPDVVGCELGGTLKNVMAIAAGMADGMGFGDNTRAALITRGLAELTRLGVAMGGHPMSFAGLTGMGDLVATCISPQSRNRHVGEQLGRGRTIEEITAEMNMVAEGVKSAHTVVELAREHGVEMPIAEAVSGVVNDGQSAVEALTTLMQRESKPELYGLE
jgi:glycerol-3-phosphate dehydrogenase (NAD(P)+)